MYRIERDDGVAPFEKSVGWLNTGQAIAIVTPGSGGYGPPEKRDPEMVRRDLQHGLATLCVGVGQGVATLIDRS